MPEKIETEEDALPFLRIDPAQKAREAAAPFDGKTNVWVPTPLDQDEGYIAADIQSQAGDIFTVVTEKGETKEIKKDDIGQKNPPKYEKCTDMANLTYLNEAGILYNLKARYEAGLIYTYSGLFCIAVNPYKRLPIYSDAVVKMYRGKRRAEMPPHVFSIVDNAYQNMLTDHDNQSMLITGESGAGKTENTKKVIQYIAKVAGVEKKKTTEEPKPDEGGVKGSLDEQVVQANPLLEAFGNAKTTRNNNSSRFGKFIRCHFSQTGKLAGADIESYLLEKNRVIHQGDAERNYHIFYQLLYATTDEQIARYCLPTRTAHDYAFLAKGVSHVDRIDDHEEYAATVDAVKVLGFTPDEMENMFKITAGILNFGNMKFKQKPRDEQAEVDDPADGERVCHLLGIPCSDFCKALTKPKVKVGTEFVNKGQNVDQVNFAVSALAKALFERMFLWMVVRVNKALETKDRREYFIGVLDIAGFEIFDYNSFEQLCINLTNEKLQQFFNHHMFVLEQEEYKKEGIHWEFIDFGMDLERTIDLVEKPMGVFAMLEEECIVPKATDKTYLEKLLKQHGGKNGNESFTKPTPKQSKQGGGDFILHHYAGSVGYHIEGWLEKNKEPMNDNAAQIFSKATNPLVAQYFADFDPDKNTGRKKGGAFLTVSFLHKEQLKKLMGTLNATSPHFVRCIIPNEKKTPYLVEGQLILHQLRCNGVLEGIRICRKGFPSRMLFQDFKQRYQILAANAIPAGFVDGKVAAEKMIEALQFDENEYKIGKTKLFFRSGIVGELEEMRDEKLSKIMSQFQAYCKGYTMRLEFQKLLAQRVGLSVIQRNVRKFMAIKNWPWWTLYLKIMPLLTVARAEEEMKEKEEALAKAIEEAEANEKKRKEMEENLTSTVAEKEKLFNELRAETDRLIETEEKLLSITSDRDKLNQSLNEALDRLDGEEHSVGKLKDEHKKSKSEIDELTKKRDEMSANISRLEQEKTSKDKQMTVLNENLVASEETVAKLGREKKGVEEGLAERTAQLQSAEDKLSSLGKAKAKLESQLKDGDQSIVKEREAKAKLDKDKRRVEGELKDTQGKLADTESELQSTIDTVAKKQKQIKELEEIKETTENQVKAGQKKIQEGLSRIEGLEDDLDAEKKLRQRGELARKDLESQLEELQEQLEQSGGATTAQVEVSKKREAECGKLRREIEDVTKAGDEAMAAAKAKFAAALQDAQDETENVKKAKQKSDKDKSALAGELADTQADLEKFKKQKASGDKANRALEEQLAAALNKISELESSLTEANNKLAKASSEGSSTGAALADSEHKLGLATKNNKSLQSQLAEATDAAESEAKAKHQTNIKLQQALSDLDSLNEQVESDANEKSGLQNKLSRALSDLAAAKAGGGGASAAQLEEFEDIKKKFGVRLQELEESLMLAETKANGLEKTKAKMGDEVEDLLLDLEKAQNQASALEKKQKKVDAQINEWKLKCDDVSAELDLAKKESRGFSAEVLKMRTANEEVVDQYSALKKEHKIISDDLRSVTEQLTEGGRSASEVEKITRQLKGENEELSLALEEIEIKFESESAKLLKLQLEHTQYKQSVEVKLSEREADAETSRRNYQRQMEALQSTIESEIKSKSELVKHRKQLESDLLEMESQVDGATRHSGDSSKTIKKLNITLKELQAKLDDEERGKDDLRDSINRAERRANELAVQLDESRVSAEQLERSRRQTDAEKTEQYERLEELQGLYNSVANGKRKAETDFHTLQADLEEMENIIKAAEDRATKAVGEVARLMNDLSSSHEQTLNAERSRSLLAKQLTEVQARAEEAEASGGRGLKNTIKQLEQKILDLETELDNEARSSASIAKSVRQADKRIKDAEFMLEDERKNRERAEEATEKLNSKCKKMRMQYEDLEASNSAWMSKYKKAAAELDEVEERSAAAEAALSKARQRARSGVTSSATTTRTSRTVSRMRTPAHGD